jgi:hypothetical protein
MQHKPDVATLIHAQLYEMVTRAESTELLFRSRQFLLVEVYAGKVRNVMVTRIESLTDACRNRLRDQRLKLVE